ncbi:uncharacterized protein B0I36DRAFT_410101 [Microdochium trichocladiopsis]|uniref:Uncharacterized protein n=1 Tax=Microdochium trichocladiopsis TaxID=1682393 RepID=A0A9P9BUM8_9PEZI|nr:uncharacterized protein B0I36DRAFT_410101 [Microdochium trichocladiopsis]KAH7031609.1 hypothetical protein B0I36DRAFT_410101 [Microdochium trichocladiopsis]
MGNNTLSFACATDSLGQSCLRSRDSCSPDSYAVSTGMCSDTAEAPDLSLIRMEDDEDETTTSPSTKTKTTTTTNDGDAGSTTTKVASTTAKTETTEKTTTTKKPSSTATITTSEPDGTPTATTSSSRPGPPTLTATVVPPTITPTGGGTSAISPSSLGTLMPTGGNTTSTAAPLPGTNQEARGTDVTAIAAGVGGAIGVLLILATLGYLIRKRRHSKRMSSTRGSSPPPFDDKTGTAEGGMTAHSSLRVEPGPVELLPAHANSVNVAPAHSHSYRTIPSTLQSAAPPAFRAGSLNNRGHAHLAQSHTVAVHEPTAPLVSPLTPVDYGSDHTSMVAEQTMAHIPPRHTESPAQYGVASAYSAHQRPARGVPCGEQHDIPWPDNSARYASRYELPGVVSPLSPEFGVSQPAAFQPQYSQQAAHGPSPYVAYRPGASRSSSANSSYFPRTAGHVQNRTHTTTPPPSSMLSQKLSQDRILPGQARSATPTTADPRYSSRQGQPQVPQMSLQTRPRLVHIGSSSSLRNVGRAASPASGVELPLREMSAIGMAYAGIGQAVSSDEGNVHGSKFRSQEIQQQQFATGSNESSQPSVGYLQHQRALPTGGHGNPASLRADMNATDAERRDDHFVNSWQKL